MYNISGGDVMNYKYAYCNLCVGLEGLLEYVESLPPSKDNSEIVKQIRELQFAGEVVCGWDGI